MKQIVLTMVALATICTQSATAQTRVSNLYTETQSLKIEKVQDTANPVQVNRYLFAGYNTLCLPMTLSAEQFAAAAKDVRIERLAAIRQVGSTVQLCFVDCTNDGIEAGAESKGSDAHKAHCSRNGDACDVSAMGECPVCNDGDRHPIGHRIVRFKSINLEQVLPIGDTVWQDQIARQRGVLGIKVGTMFIGIEKKRLP